LDSGYQGIKEKLRAMIPIKETVTIKLSTQEKQYNTKLSQHRVIIENSYGRLKKKFKIMNKKLKCSEFEKNKQIYDFCFALTNLDMMISPLRSEDGDYYKKSLIYWKNKESEKKKKRKISNLNYSEKKRKFQQGSDDDDSEEE
jgi:hypothetical protein